MLPSKLFSTETYPHAYPWLHRDNMDDIPTLTNYINGEFVPSKATSFIEVKNPAKNEIISRVPERLVDYVIYGLLIPCIILFY